MKKAAIFTAGIIIFTILAGFNYLLWDNMIKKEKLNESELINSEKSQSIDYLLDEINALKDDIRTIRQARDELQREVNSFDEVLELKQEEIDEKDTQLQNIYEDINNYFLIINALKQAADNDYFINYLTTNWATPINEGQFSTSYIYQGSRLVLGDTKDTVFNSFKDQFASVEFIEVVSADKVELTKSESNQEEYLEYLEYKVQLNITLTKNEEGLPIEDEFFVEGINVFFFTFKFDTMQSMWIITSMK